MIRFRNTSTQSEREKPTQFNYEYDTCDVRKASVDNTDFGHIKIQPKKKNGTRSVTIIGDSIIREVKAHNLKKFLPRSTRPYVRSESSATVQDMIDYVNPSRKYNPDLYIFHAGTNDLRSGKEPMQIANEIIHVASSLKTSENDVAISGIVKRNDGFNEKGKIVNSILRMKARELGLGYVDHENIHNHHLNNGGLHLNEEGDDVLTNNFANFIKI